MKRCNGPCNLEKTFDHFHKGNGSYGLKSRCKECCKISYKKRSKEQANEYYKLNADKLRLYKAAYYKANINKERKVRRKFDQQNKAVKSAREMKRYCGQLRATPPWLTKEHLQQIKEFYLLRDELTKKTGIAHHVDHIMPLRGKILCGLHVPWNLQVITEKQNVQKSNKVV